MSEDKPEVLLNHMLSTKSTSCMAEWIHARDDSRKTVLTTVGKGQCGTVYALGTTMAIKIPNSPKKADELFREFQIHYAVKHAFANLSETMRYNYNINIPEPKMWVNHESSHFWTEHAHGIVIPNYCLISERILPLPLFVRSAIIDTFCPESVRERKDDFLMIDDNNDCLVRVNLGRQRKDSPISVENFRLRNFPLHIDEMEHIKLDVQLFAKTIAQALAIMHWKVGIDANDVEFVLGCSPLIGSAPGLIDVESKSKDTLPTYFTCKHRRTSLWLLDFNQCTKFSKDNLGLKKLVDGFWWNDPYYPRPGDKLWGVFTEHYFKVSSEFEPSMMPMAFIDGVVEVDRRRLGGSLFG